MGPMSNRPFELSADCRAVLGDDRVALHDRLADDPRALMDALRHDPELGAGLVRCDTLDGLAFWFSPEGDGWSSEPDRSGPLGDAAFGVAWQFEGRHDKEPHPDDERFPLGATNRRVIVRGFTILVVDVDDAGLERVRVRRYVDWAGLYGQLGLTLNWRVPLPPAI